MPLSIKQFLLHLAESNVLSREAQRALIEQGNPNQLYKSSEYLARALVKSGALTAYQAQMVYQGKGDRLTLGNYVLLDKIGSGGMGTVYRAMHRRMERIVALKELPQKLMQDEISVQRFHREVKAAARLSHPNIVTAHDADETKGVHYLVMELVEGQDLSSYVKMNGPLAVAKSVHCITQAARGLEYAHSQNVVHRDIKPANLLLDQAGTIKILDMGLARFDSEAMSEDSAELTATGTVVGTVDYMSPEQALNTSRIDSRSDIYSLGITLYYLLTGHPAYLGKTAMERLVAHRENPIPSLCAERPDVPVTLHSVFEKMVAKKAEDRYQTMTEVIAALEISNQAPVTAPIMQRVISEDAKLNEFLESLEREAEMHTVSDVDFDFGPNSSAQEAAAQTKLLSDPDLTSDPKTISAAAVNARKRTSNSALAWIQVNKIPASLAGGFLLLILFIIGDSGGRTSDKNDENLSVSEDASPNSVETPTDNDSPDSGLPETIGAHNPADENSGDNYALSFNGSDAYVEVPDLRLDEIPLDQPLTIEMTINANQTNGAANLISWLGDNWIAIFQNMNGDGEPRWGVGRRFGGQSILQRSRSELPLGEWVRLAVVIRRDQFQLFMNGELQEVDNYDFSLEPTQGGLFIGGAPLEKLTDHRDDRWFDGSIDELKISRGALYRDSYDYPEVLTADVNTLALFTFNEIAGRPLQVVDSSSFQRHGVIHGATREQGFNSPETRRFDLRMFENRPASGLIFDGDADFVDLPGLKFDPAQPITIEARIDPDLGSRAGSLITFSPSGFLNLSRDSESGWKVLLGRNPRNVTRWVSDGSVDWKNGVVCLTIEEMIPRLFIDGQILPLVRDRQVAIPRSISISRRSSTLGGFPVGLGRVEDSFHGRFLELIISSDIQHTENYVPQIPFQQDFSTRALYRFDQSAGPFLRDSSNSRLHGRIHNAQWDYDER